MTTTWTDGGDRGEREEGGQVGGGGSREGLGRGGLDKRIPHHYRLTELMVITQTIAQIPSLT